MENITINIDNLIVVPSPVAQGYTRRSLGPCPLENWLGRPTAQTCPSSSRLTMLSLVAQSQLVIWKICGSSHWGP